MRRMGELRAGQIELLAVHRERAFDAFTRAAADKGGAQLRDAAEGRTLLAQPPELLVSVAVTAAAAAVETRRGQQQRADSGRSVSLELADVFPFRVLSALERRRLPFDDDDVELLLDLGASTMEPDRILVRSYEVLSLGVSAAGGLLRTRPASASVIGALERAGAAIDALALTPGGTPGRLRRRVRELVAANVPGGLLDLSVLDGPDAWSPLAAEVLTRHAERWDGVHDALALFAATSGTRPSKAWRRRSATLAAAGCGYGELLRDLLEPVLHIDLTPSDLPWPPAWLLAPGNELLARGATWATADVHEEWVVPLVGRLALRCAAPSPHPTVTTALAHGVASASVEALAAMGTTAADEELRVLLVEIRRRDLLKRIAAIVGERPEETSARDERIRLDKQRAVQRKAAHEPKERQRAASADVRKDLAPALREEGFDDSAGRTFWRTLEDRVEVLHGKASSGGLSLELGIWFRFVPRRTAVTEKDGRLRPAVYDCDFRGDLHPSRDELGSAAGHVASWFSRWRPLQVVLDRLVSGAQTEDAWGYGAPDSPRNSLLGGYLARELGDLSTAYAKLVLAAGYYRDRLEHARANSTEPVTPDWEAWVSRIENDATA
jgi:hypothetical protein